MSEPLTYLEELEKHSWDGRACFAGVRSAEGGAVVCLAGVRSAQRSGGENGENEDSGFFSLIEESLIY